MVRIFHLISVGVFVVLALLASVWPPVLWSLVILGPLVLLGSLALTYTPERPPSA